MALPELLPVNSPVPGRREPLTTLAETLSPSDMTLELASGLPEELSGPGQTRLTIDNEIILVDATSGTGITVIERGAEESIAAEHSIGVKVYGLPTRGAWITILSEYASLTGHPEGQAFAGATEAGYDLLLEAYPGSPNSVKIDGTTGAIDLTGTVDFTPVSVTISEIEYDNFSPGAGS